MSQQPLIKTSIVLSLSLALLLPATADALSWKLKKAESKGQETTEPSKPSLEETPVSEKASRKEKEETTEEEKPRDFYNKGVEQFQIGQIQAEKGNLSGQKSLLREAIRNFELAVKQDPKLVEAQSNIGFAYLTLKDYNQAIKAFKKALEINPKHLNTLNGLSTVYALDGKADEAIATFKELTTLDPSNPQYFANMGSVLQKAGQFEEAKQAYQEALRLDPQEQRSLFNLGTLYENLGELEAAKPYYEKAKGVAVGNTIGLESIRRIEGINTALQAGPQVPLQKQRGK